MTIEDAIQEMKLLRRGAEVNGHQSTVEAFDVAIEALEQVFNK